MSLEEKVDLIFDTLLVNGMLVECGAETLTQNRIYPIEKQLDAIGRNFKGKIEKVSSENELTAKKT